MATIRMGELKNKEVALTVPFEGDSFELRYRPHLITAALISDVTAKIDAVDTHSEVCAIFQAELPAILTSWNLVDDSGQPLPITAATLGDLAAPAAMVFWRAIQEHMRPNLESAGS